MVLKEDQERIKTLLKDTITLLCRNGLTFKTEFSIEALIGITLDKDDILLVNINEIIRTELGNKLAAAAEQSDQESVGDDWEDGSGDDVSPRGTPHSQSQKKRRKRHRSSGSQRNDGGGGGGHGDMSNTSFPDDSSTHSEPPVKRQSTLPNSRNSMKNENDDDSKDIVFIKEEVDTGDWSHTSQGPGHFPADLSGIPSQHQQEHFDNFLQGGSLVPVGAQQSSANLWSDMTGGPGSSMNQTMSPPGSKRSSTVTSNAAATPGDDSQQKRGNGDYFDHFTHVDRSPLERSRDTAMHTKPICKKELGSWTGKDVHRINQTGIRGGEGGNGDDYFDYFSYSDRGPIERSQNTAMYTCPICKKELTSWSGMDAHMRNHTGMHRYFCDVCHKGFNSQTNYKNHARQHSGERVCCPHCESSFQTTSGLQYHLRTRHAEKRPESSNTSGNM